MNRLATLGGTLGRGGGGGGGGIPPHPRFWHFGEKIRRLMYYAPKRLLILAMAFFHYPKNEF